MDALPRPFFRSINVETLTPSEKRMLSHEEARVIVALHLGHRPATLDDPDGTIITSHTFGFPVRKFVLASNPDGSRGLHELRLVGACFDGKPFDADTLYRLTVDPKDESIDVAAERAKFQQEREAAKQRRAARAAEQRAYAADWRRRHPFR
jgi:hypothetical protein